MCNFYSLHKKQHINYMEFPDWAKIKWRDFNQIQLFVPDLKSAASNWPLHQISAWSGKNGGLFLHFKWYCCDILTSDPRDNDDVIIFYVLKVYAPYYPL